MHTPPLCVARPHGENSHTLCASSRNILTPYVNQKGKFSHPTCIIKGNSPSLCACTRHPSQKFSHLMRSIRRNSHILHALQRKFSQPMRIQQISMTEILTTYATCANTLSSCAARHRMGFFHTLCAS